MIAAIYSLSQRGKSKDTAQQQKPSQPLIAAKQTASPMTTYSLRKLAELCGPVQVLNKTPLSVMY